MLASLFRAQIAYCTDLGSPFTAALLECALREIEADGPLAKMLSTRAWTGPDALPLRFAGAVHHLALTEPAFGALYPASNPNWRIEDVWSAAQMLMRERPAHFDDFLAGPPQTNETRRSIALLPAFLEFGPGPLHMLEIGASAGLNLQWDRFRYRATDWSWGEGDGPVIDTDWRGPPPAYLGPLPVASRAGCDLNPMDVSNPAHRMRLRAYIWADMPERIARFEAAADLAIAAGTHVDKADAADWIEAKLAGALPEGVTVIYHSVVWQYVPEAAKARIVKAIEATAKRATSDRRLAWVRYEYHGAPASIGGRYLTDSAVWPGSERRIIAEADPHVRWVESNCAKV